MHSKILGLIAHLLCAAPQAGAAELPWDALPQPPDDDTQVEAVLVVRDLRGLQGWAEHVRGVLREVPVGEALTSAETPNVWGFDLWHDVAAWLDLAAPGDDAVPAALTLLSTNGDLGWQGQLPAGPHILERLRAAQATPVADTNGLWRLPRGAHTVFAQEDGHGWLRVAPDRHWLTGGATEVPPALHKAQVGFAGHDVALVLLGQGSVAKRLLRLANPALHTLGESVRAAGIAWRLGDAQTTQLRMLVDAPLLETLAPVLRKRQLVDPFTRTLGDDMQGLAVLAVPPPFVKALPAWAETHLGGTAAALPANVHELLTHFEGHLAFVSYDAPGDWAVAAQFDAAGSAAQMVPALQTWAQQLAAGLAPGGQQVLAMESFAGTAGQVFHLRPEAHLEGPYMAARGASVLFVQQRSRLRRLLQSPDGPPDVGPDPNAARDPGATAPRGLLAAPMTMLMRESLSAPHMVSGYKVLGSDAAWLDYLVWMAGRLQAAVQAERDRHPEDAVLSPLIDRLPQWVGALSYLWLCTYDVGLTADVLGPLLVVDVTHSEI